MRRFERAKSKLKLLIDQIGQVRLDGRAGLGVLPEIREALGLDVVMYFRFVHRPRGWAVEGFESEGLASTALVRRALGEYFTATAPTGQLPWLDLANPPQAHCNKAIVLTDEVGPETLRTSAFYERVIVPSALGDSHFVRVLLCEGELLRGWLGGASRSPITEDQRAMLEALVEPLLVRMRIERSLAAAPRVHAGIEQALQYVRAPALIVDNRGRIHAANRAASELTAHARDEALAEIAAVIDKRLPSPKVTVLSAGMSEGTERFLAILSARSDDERREQAAALAGLKWQLTQREVHLLKRLVDGASNSEIAGELRMTDPEVEQQIGAILNRARVTNRSQLVAAVLGG